MGISVTDSLPAGLVYVSSVPAAVTNASLVIWTNLGNLAAGATTNLTLTVISTASGTVTNIASGGSPTLDPNSTNNVTPPVVTVIGKAMPVVTWPVPTNIVYGTPLGTNQNDATLPVDGTYNYSPTNGVVLPVGTNTLIVTFMPTDTNYMSTNLTVQLVVLPAPLTITAGPQSKAYGTTLALGTTNFMASGLVNGDTVMGVTLTSSGSGAGATVGSYDIVASAATGTGLTNYTISYNNGTLTVSAAALSITAGPQSKPYGTILVLGTTNFTTSGLVNSDTVTRVTLSSTGSGAGATVGSYNIVASAAMGTGLTNYTINYNNGTLTVSAAALSITAGPQSKAYGTTLALGTTNFTASGLLNSDTVTGVTLTSSGSGAGATVGNYNIVASAATGTGLTNYTISYNNGTLTVSSAALSITAGAQKSTVPRWFWARLTLRPAAW